jgi:hypothetical protein
VRPATLSGVLLAIRTVMKPHLPQPGDAADEEALSLVLRHFWACFKNGKPPTTEQLKTKAIKLATKLEEYRSVTLKVLGCSFNRSEGNCKSRVKLLA